MDKLKIIPLQRRRLCLFYSLLCVPSHMGFLADCLQAQKKTLRSASALYATGAKVLPLWAPSQKGWAADFPQAHQK